jgi:hypothetical protein
MDIDQSALVVANERCAQDSHEPGEDYQLGIESVDQFDQSRVEGFTTFKRGVIKEAGFDARVLGALQAERIGTVGNHRADSGRLIGAVQAIDHGLQIAAGAG